MNINDLKRALEDAMPKEPVLQAIAVLDCPATQDTIVKLPHGVDLIEIVQHFGPDAATVVRWFFSNPSRIKMAGEMFSTFTFDLKPRVVNEHGYAFVMSEKYFNKLVKTFTFDAVTGVTIQNLNKASNDDPQTQA